MAAAGISKRREPETLNVKLNVCCAQSAIPKQRGDDGASTASDFDLKLCPRRLSIILSALTSEGGCCRCSVQHSGAGKCMALFWAPQGPGARGIEVGKSVYYCVLSINKGTCGRHAKKPAAEQRVGGYLL